MTTTLPPQTVTVDQATQALAAARHASQQYGTRRARTLVEGNKMHWTNFRGDEVVAHMVGNKIEAVFSVNGDGKTPDPRASAQIEIPPMSLTRKSRTNLEGNAFKKGGHGEKKFTVPRTRAKYSVNTRVGGTSKEFAERWQEAFNTDLIVVQTDVCKEIAKACRKLVRDTWTLDDSGFKPFKDTAIQHARDIVAQQPEYATMNPGQFISACTRDEALRERVNAVALEYYVKNANIMCEPRYDKESGEELPLIVFINSKVYKIRDYSNGKYNKDATGPTETELPSTLENMPAVIDRMAKLDNGLDARDFRMLKYVDGSKPPGNPDYHVARPTVVIDGKTVPDYSWDPLHFNSDGESVASVVVMRGTFMLTASPVGGYGATLALAGGRVIQIVSQDVIESLPTMNYGMLLATGVANGRVTTEPAKKTAKRSRDDDDSALAEQATKMRAAATVGSGVPSRVPTDPSLSQPNVSSVPPPITPSDSIVPPVIAPVVPAEELFDLFPTQ